MHRIFLSGALVGLFVLPGCRNDCQKICTEMSDVYDDCDIDYSQSDLQSCFESQEEPSESELLTCGELTGELETTLAEQSGSGDACDVLLENSSKWNFDKVLDGF